MTPGPFQSRPIAIGYSGAASTPHLLASRAAIAAMQAGGNAVDAAVTAAAVATVAQPFTSSVGGVGWASVYDAASGQTEVLQFLGAVPHGCSIPGCSAGTPWGWLTGAGWMPGRRCSAA